MKNIQIIEIPTDLGLGQMMPHPLPGVRKLPKWLSKHGFLKQLGDKESISIQIPDYSGILDPESRILHADLIANYSILQAQLIRSLMEDNLFPIVLGGDCSILIGNAIALRQMGDFAIFYLDGHTDFMDISFSESGGAAGMAASLVTGNGSKKLSDILGLSPYIKEENLYCVGNREYDEEYEDQIRKSTANYIRLDELREKGIGSCTQSFLNAIHQARLTGFWLHIDVDVLNDQLMPCVDSRTPGGLSYEEFLALLNPLLKSQKLAGLNITILDPDLDRQGIHTTNFVKHVNTLFHHLAHS